MNSTDTLILALTAATWAQASFCLTFLLCRAWDYPLYLPLAALFLILCFASGGPLVATFAPSWLIAFYEVTVPAYLLMGPALWFYFDGLMTTGHWRPKRSHLIHLIPAGLGLILIWLDIMVVDVTPASDQERLLKQSYIAVVATLWGVTLIGGLWQLVFMIRDVLKRLPLYRQALSMTLSNHDHAGLRGAEGVFPVVGLFWLIVLGSVIMRNVTGIDFPPPSALAAIFTLLVWSLGLWSLRQVPGLASREAQPVETDATSAKYQKSALSPEQAQRIAARLNAAMETERLYLDANLSLPGLARHLRIAPNPISQTLNGVIGLSFFDYVNRWRIEAAKSEMAGDKSVLEIAYDSGFNARSSFYRAFQKETGLSPVAYRQQLRDQASTSASSANS